MVPLYTPLFFGWTISLIFLLKRANQYYYQKPLALLQKILILFLRPSKKTFIS
jgi:hypothetical protein